MTVSLPVSMHSRIVTRHDGDRRIRTLSCAEQYRVMAFTQLTYRESLRDIEACLSVQTAKLYHAGFREPVRGATLADVNEARAWRERLRGNLREGFSDVHMLQIRTIRYFWPFGAGCASWVAARFPRL
jgi:hypothetical protein